jgi:uncharacterized membrane protein YvbJ
MLYCKKCGTKLADDVQYCYKCGTSITTLTVQPQPIIQSQPTYENSSSTPQHKDSLLIFIMLTIALSLSILVIVAIVLMYLIPINFNVQNQFGYPDLNSVNLNFQY